MLLVVQIMLLVVQLMLLVVQLMCISVKIKLTQPCLAGVGTEHGNKE